MNLEPEPFQYNEPFYFNIPVSGSGDIRVNGIFYFKISKERHYIFAKGAGNRWPSHDEMEILPEIFNQWIKEKKIQRATDDQIAKSLLSG